MKTLDTGLVRIGGLFLGVAIAAAGCGAAGLQQDGAADTAEVAIDKSDGQERGDANPADTSASTTKPDAGSADAEQADVKPADDDGPTVAPDGRTDSAPADGRTDGAPPDTLADGRRLDVGATDSGRVDVVPVVDGQQADAGKLDGANVDTAKGGCLGGTKPGPSTTGVPAGTVLTASGSLTITTSGTVINGLNINGCVNVQAKNVVIRNTLIRCTDYYPVRVFDGASLLIEDSEIAASGGIATSGVAFANYTARRLNVHGAADGLKSDSNVLVEDCWIHDLWLGNGDHADGAQSTGGDNVIYRRNFIDIVDHGQGHGGEPNSCFQVGTEAGPDSNFVIDGNWLYGGGWVINMGAGAAGNRIVNNCFGRGQGYPQYGPMSVPDSDPTHVTISGNVWDDTGAPIK